MAFADDFEVDVTGNITHTSGTTTYPVIDLHRYLQDLADNSEVSSASNDVAAIFSSTPSERITDEIINLINGYNIDETCAEFLYGGSITQGSGATQERWSGLKVLGSVVSTATQIQIVQDKYLYDGDAPFWGDQTSPFNGGGATLMRCLVKSREFGCDIDQAQIRVQARNYGDTYASFDVTLGVGEAVAAVSTVDDPQNDTAQGTVDAYTHVTNTEGFQSIDIGDGNGVQPYYSQWTYGADTSGDQLKAVWEWAKNETRTGASTAAALYWVDGTADDEGECFRGITHSYSYNNLSGSFTEDNEVVWGTGVTYDTLAGGTFTVGNYIRFGTGGNAGRIMYDNGTTFMVVALEDITGDITPVDTEVMTEYAVQKGDAGTPGTGATSVTAAVDTTTPVADPTLGGGSGVLLANDTTGTKHHIELRTGVAPVDTLEIRDGANTCDVNGSVTSRTVTPVFLGSYVGTLIGGYGVGIDSDDLTNLDTVTDLDGDINTPPNNVTWTLGGLISTEDQILVGPKDTGNAFKWDQMTLSTALATTNRVEVVVNAIPANTPQTGTLRIELDDGRYRRQAYTAHDGTDTFTIASADYTDPDDASSTNNVMVSYLDKEAASTDEAFTTIYTSGPLPLWIRVRDGGVGKNNTPIKTYEGQGSLTSTGGSATASRIDDY